MARSVYVTGIARGDGRQVVELGLMELLSRRSDRVGVFRPLTHRPNDDMVDLLRSRYRIGLPPGLLYGMDYEAAAALRAERGEDELVSVLVDRFREVGGTFLDTADCYIFWREGCTGRESELLLGRWLADRGCRDELVISTKLGGQPVGPAAGGRPGELAWSRNAEGLSRQVVAQAAEGSLGRLGIEGY